MHDALRELVTRVEQLYEDVSLEAVRRWKAEEPGRKAIGYMPTAVPREIIHASGMLPVGIVGAGDQIEIIRGDAYFQSYICHIPRSTVELAVSGRLEPLDGMLFPSTCDVIRNLSGMWTLLFPNRYVRYMDSPQNFDPRVGGEFYGLELRSLWEDLGKLGGQPPDDMALARSIGVYNENRKAIQDLYEARSRQPWQFPTPETYLFLRAGLVLSPEEHTSLLRRYLAEAPRDPERRERDYSRVVLVGTFCEQPPVGLLRTLENAGCWIVDDDLLLGQRWLTQSVEVEGDPLQCLAEAFLRSGVANASRYEPERGKGRRLIDTVRRRGAEGVIFCAPSFCDPALLDQPMLVRALDEAGIAHTQFKYAENTGQFGAIREQAGTFSDSIRLWSDA